MRSKIAEFQKSAAGTVEAKDEAWFYEQLSDKTEVLPRGKEFVILCPFHNDSHPSLEVNKVGGFFHCWSCGAGGGWNKLATRLGMEKLKYQRDSSSMDEMTAEMFRSLRSMGVSKTSVNKTDKSRPLVFPWPESRDWRGLSGSLLADIGCQRVLDMVHSTERIGLPIRTPTGDLLGYTCRAINPADAEPKYTPLTADRVGFRTKELPADKALFLIDKVDGDRVVLVEGPVDAMRLYAQGIPAVAILGTSNWNAWKAATLAGLGVTKVLVMMDADESGQDAKRRILASIPGSKALRLPDGTKDPGDLDPEQVAWVKQRVEKL